MALRWLMAAVVILVSWLGSCGSAQVEFVYDFAIDGQGFSVVNQGRIEDPWSYDADLGAWSVNGSGGVGVPTSSGLRTPVFQVQSADPVTLSFDHRYSIEYSDDIRWDGAAVMISVNGDGFRHIGNQQFTQGGYVGEIEGNNALQGLQGFSSLSSGYFDLRHITSQIDLGVFELGDAIQLEFLGAWDEFSRGQPDETLPNWEIDSVRFQGPLSEITTTPPPKLTFYPIADISVSTADTDLWSVNNLIQGPGEGFQTDHPY
ncbi:MAG: hypothetical protein KDA87_10050, partial [Planctomycetales bacterium]|nr:hypothetical protein [Planctomycetales bacterium]